MHASIQLPVDLTTRRSLVRQTKHLPVRTKRACELGPAALPSAFPPLLAEQPIKERIQRSNRHGRIIPKMFLSQVIPASGRYRQRHSDLKRKGLCLTGSTGPPCDL